MIFLTLCILRVRGFQDSSPPSPDGSRGNNSSCSTDTPHKLPNSLKTSGTSCPPGLFCTEGKCECGTDYPYFITCARSDTSADVSVLARYCATSDYKSNLTLVGATYIYTLLTTNSSNPKGKFAGESVFYRLPKTAEKLNTACDNYNRTGTLCGQCLPDHYPLAYSFNMTCIPCPRVNWNWFRYIMAAYLPLTAFYVVVLFFKLNIISSHLFAVVYYCQALAMPPLMRVILIRITWHTNLQVTGIFASVYGIWNLDFFRPFYSDLCLGLGILPTLALDYAVAVYPLLLMVITYILITLYDKNYRIVTIMWTPFRWLFSLLRKNWDIRTSVIDAFATFFLLSSTKFLSVSLDLLTPTKVYQLYPDHYNYTLRLYYAQDIEYFSKEHLPYAILAIVVLCIFVVLPVATLALYPFQFFQRFLNLFPFRSLYVLHTFMDAFQGCYKDGTEPGSHDHRYFAALFFILRYLQVLLFFILDYEMFTVVFIMMLILHVSLLVIFQPFKAQLSHLNVINIIFLQFLALYAAAMAGAEFAFIMLPSFIHFFTIIGGVLGIVPLLYAIGMVSHWIYTHKKSGVGLVQRLRAFRNGYRPIAGANETLPDRIENARQYPRKNMANFSAAESYIN